jgi:type IX secretion system PorP/SprF family membrane protein
MKKAFILLCMVTMWGSYKLSAQVDPHFSQYYVYPSWLNPALTGIFDGNYRVAAIYRNQWNSVSSPFSTIGATADISTDKNLNFGISLLDQKAGDAGYHYMNGYASVSYSGIRFGSQGYQRLSFGMQGGFINRKITPGKFQFGDQWNPTTGYSASNPTSDFIANTSSTTFDLGAGLLFFDGDPSHKANLFAGFSASHLTQPEDPFTSGTKEKLPIRYTGHAGIRLTLSETFSITPNGLYLRQGNAEEKMAGAYGTLKANDYTELLIGANYRFKDAFAPFLGLNYRNFVLGLSYDVNTSNLGKAVSGTNSFEISLSYIGRKTYKYKEQHFVCPRL